MAKDLFKEEVASVKEKMDRFFLTSGYNFEGHNIKKYCGPAVGDCLGGTFFTVLLAPIGKYPVFTDLMERDGLDAARHAAIARMLTAAEELRANGVIGISFQYTNVGKDGLLITVSGTAVIVE